MSKPILCGVLTLSPTHCGTGQASGAVDLPIARETHTHLPVLPASTLKGVIREWLGKPDDKKIQSLFGPRLRRRAPSEDMGEARTQTSDDTLQAGDLVFFEGCLLAFPVRSLTGVFRWITAPMLISRLQRIMRALQQTDLTLTCPTPKPHSLLLPSAQHGPVSLEDLVFSAGRCQPADAVDILAEQLGRLMANTPADADRTALAERLVVVPDEVLQDLVRRSTPVNARIVLDPKTKTSDNLWYEETLPPDTLFAVIIADRPGVSPEKTPVATMRSALKQKHPDNTHYGQLGGNVTVGQGLVRWTLNVELS